MTEITLNEWGSIPGAELSWAAWDSQATWRNQVSLGKGVQMNTIPWRVGSGWYPCVQITAVFLVVLHFYNKKWLSDWCMVVGVNWIYGDNYFTVYTSIESLCCTLETNIMLDVKYISIKMFLILKMINKNNWSCHQFVRAISLWCICFSISMLNILAIF